jgi:hypothetical protein
MKKLVTIISEQSIQNLIFLNYFSDHDEIIFISTIEMKNKGLMISLFTYTKIQKKCSCLIIDSEKPYLIEQALKDYNFNSDSLYSINITGGTKIMSLILYRFFSSFNHRNFYYLPINKSYMLDIEKEEADEAKIRLNDLVDIKSYLKYMVLKSRNMIFRFFLLKKLSTYINTTIQKSIPLLKDIL